MANRHLLLKDTQNRICQYMGFVGQDIDDLLTNNIVEMLKAKMEIQIETLDRHYSDDELEKIGWKNDQALYDKLLIQYTQNTSKVLKRWC